MLSFNIFQNCVQNMKCDILENFFNIFQNLKYKHAMCYRGQREDIRFQVQDTAMYLDLGRSTC